MVHRRRVMVARVRPRASRSRANNSISARRAPNNWGWCRWHQLANWRRSSSYACRVRPEYPARNPAKARRSVLVWRTPARWGPELWTGRDGHQVPPGTHAETPKLGQPRPQKISGTAARCRVCTSLLPEPFTPGRPRPCRRSPEGGLHAIMRAAAASSKLR